MFEDEEDSLIQEVDKLQAAGTFEGLSDITSILDRATELERLAAELGRTLAFRRQKIFDVWQTVTTIPANTVPTDGPRGILPRALELMILPDAKITPQYGLRAAFVRAFKRWREYAVN